MILIAFRHGLRASELCELQWSDVEFETGNLHLRRSKGGATGTHPLLGDELRALRVLKREAKSPFIFVSERGSPFSVSGLAKLIERAGIEAKMIAARNISTPLNTIQSSGSPGRELEVNSANPSRAFSVRISSTLWRHS
ncbi:MAG TPA: tyrosine-type recombinase/integrase [Pseudolabrys sp.]